jgi:hypothetical protein
MYGSVLPEAMDLAQRVAAVLDRGRDRVVLAAMGERLLVERLEEHLHLLLEELLVGFVVEHRRAEALDFSRVITASDSHDDATVGHDVGGRVILGEAHGMPHREDVEGAAELEPLGLGRQPRAEENEVREHLVALVLEVMLGRPQAVVTVLVHELSHVPGGVVRLDQPLVRVAPVVGGRPLQPHVLQLDLPDVEDREFRDHLALHPPSTTMACPVMYPASSEAR